MEHPKDTPLDEWLTGWLELEVASLLDVPGYILMPGDKKLEAGYPVTRDEMIDFIQWRRETDAWLAAGGRP